ncbi:hypothetical protein ASD65_01535 [Microbacterium sp. Root61]|uniref:ABC transporter permease subunit n=1 Tax=Microbacterium sp. Root61 TaxID=1736570 RepID=UPI0006FFFACE|nr:ABC transporter permease subunit [Microbacterium sp. Root61]KRA23244.1 hypothetical protein ASD65_01535 [Microbacterium sp. Root61]
MSTLTAGSTAARTHTVDASPYRLSFAHLVRGEWIKLVTLRSTWWSFGMVALISIGLSLLMATSMSAFLGDSGPLSVAEINAQAVMVVLFSTVLTQLLAVVIGAISVTGEYSTGMIRSTLTAAPQRIPSLLAKALVVGVSLFVSTFVVFVIAALVTGPILPTGAMDLSDLNSSLMPLLGASFYLAIIAILGVGIGFIIRNGPGALAAGIGLVFVAPLIVGFFPRIPDLEWLHTLASYLPSNAGQSLFMGSPMSGDVLETVPAVLTLIAWAVVALVGGSTVLKTRDA